MYASHFGLTERPFSLAPDPRYLFMSDGHREALAHLLYGLGEGGGFVQLTGEVGTGKTTVCRALLEQLPADVDVAMIFNPRLTSVELLATVCDELHVPYPEGTTSLKVLVDAMSRALLDAHARGRRTVLIIDEAQNLSMEVLEELRLLTNLETTRHKLLQVILIGQPELAAVLRRPQLRQLAQRITARYHLRPFTLAETRAYVEHRMAVAGRRKPIFTAAALRAAHRRAGGIPRLINSVCDRALLGAFGKGRSRVTAPIVFRAATEVLGRPVTSRRWTQAAAAVTLLAAVTVGAAVVGTARLGRLPGGWGVPAPRPGVSPAAATVAAAPEPPQPPRPPQPAQPPQPSLLSMLAALGPKADRASAFTALYAQWGVEYRAQPGVLGCEYGRPEGFRCLFRSGTWTLLRRLDLPAMLPLTTAAGRQYAVLTTLAEDTATLAIGDRTVTAPLAEIERLWDGDFVALWKAPGLVVSPLRPGMGGTSVRWLRQRLGDAGDAQVGAGLVYDDDLRRRVVAFQQAHALAPDGIAGEETLVRLSRLTPGATVPSLSGGKR